MLIATNNKKMQKTTFTLSEAAELLRCHKETLRRAILDGGLQAARLGRGYRISRMDLQKFWTENGGGELFDRPAFATETDEQQKAKDTTKKKSGLKNNDGPHQLTLPLA